MANNGYYENKHFGYVVRKDSYSLPSCLAMLLFWSVKRFWIWPRIRFEDIAQCPRLHGHKKLLSASEPGKRFNFHILANRKGNSLQNGIFWRLNMMKSLRIYLNQRDGGVWLISLNHPMSLTHFDSWKILGNFKSPFDFTI